MKSADLIVERGSLINKLKLWKFLFVVVAILFLIKIFENKLPIPGVDSDYIAQITVEGVITEDPKLEKLFEQVKNDRKAKALIVYINSPGGAPVAAEKIYYLIEEIKETKPVVVSMGTYAASGGYLAALSADRIFAYNSTITGSIGVILMSPDVTELQKKLGVKVNNFKSSPLKASPNPSEVVTAEQKEVIMQTIITTYDFFVELVAKNRQMSLDQVKKLADGRVYTGRQAVDLNLIDEIGNMTDILEWLEYNRKISKLKVVELKINRIPLIFDILDGAKSYLSSFKTYLHTKIMMII